MTCQACGADNRADRRFCRECGASLVAGCPSCGAVNEPDDRFCGSCGTALGTAIFQKDFLVVQGIVLVIAVGFVLVNFLVDLLYAVVDPRVRHVRA